MRPPLMGLLPALGTIAAGCGLPPAGVPQTLSLGGDTFVGLHRVGKLPGWEGPDEFGKEIQLEQGVVLTIADAPAGRFVVELRNQDGEIRIAC